MLARCVSNARTNLQVNQDREEALLNLPFFDVPLKIGADYQVASIIIFRNVILYLVASDLGSPVFAPADLFTLEESIIPSHWVFRYVAEPDGVTAILGYKPLAIAESAMEDLIEGEDEAVGYFRQELRLKQSL